MNMMREMFEVREANAELRAKIEFMEQHHAHTATSPHRPYAPASLRAPQQRVTFSSQPNQPRRIVAQPRQPSQQIHPPQPIHPPHGLIPPKQILPTVPATPAKPANYSIVKLPSAPGQTIATPNPKQLREIARLTQQLKELHQELKKAKKLNADTKESGCNGTSCRGTKE